MSKVLDVGKDSISKTRSSTVHKMDSVKKGMFNQYRTTLNESKNNQDQDF